ncbi:MAG: DUF177 domain-containing protein [Flavobacteriaceae bacterium]|jgi:uncharacterized metal-binding protein YceD (DUF177 family)|nr:DUF177 domain-containing protein [Flavobacteriaceae bacterium]
MEKLQHYDLSFSGLTLGKHRFEFDIDRKFFDLFDFNQEFANPKIKAEIMLNKHSSFLELSMETSGTVSLICDISEVEFEQPVQNKIELLVKSGEEFDDSDEEVLVLPFGSHSVNVAQLIFESVIISIPMKHIHPKYQNGYHDEYTDLIEKYSPTDDK